VVVWGGEVEVIGLNAAGRTLVERVGQHDKAHLPAVAGH
jgi:SulP family sulfate permease